LRPAADLRPDSGAGELVGELGDRLVDCALALAAAAFEKAGDAFVEFGLEVAERQVFQFPLELPHAEAIGERRVDVERFARELRSSSEIPTLRTSDSTISARSGRVVETMLRVYPTLWRRSAPSRIIRLFPGTSDARRARAAADAGHPAAVGRRRVLGRQLGGCARDHSGGSALRVVVLALGDRIGASALLHCRAAARGRPPHP